MKITALLLSASLLASAGGSQAAELVTSTSPSPVTESAQSTPKAPAIADFQVDSDTRHSPCSTSFTDVSRGHSFYETITWMGCAGLTVGYADGSFRPYQQITRAEVAAFLYRLSGDAHSAGSRRDFTDVPVTSTHFEAISWMKEQGLSLGYADGTFAPSKSISRGEVATFMYRYGETTGRYVAPSTSPFTDLVGHQGRFYYGPATWMQATGMISGYTDGTFRPERMVTRGETSKFLYALNAVLDGQVPLPSGPGVEVPNIAGHRWTKAQTPLFSRASFSSSAVMTLPAQAELVQLAAPADNMVKVRHVASGRQGWVSSSFTTVGRPGTTDKQFPNPKTNAQRSANNISPWCWGVPVTTGGGVSGGYAWFSRGGHVVEEGITLMMDGVGPNEPVAVAVQYHECAHILQYRAYGYNPTALDAAMDALYPKGGSNTFLPGYSYVEGTEHMADCIADAMGATRSSRGYVAGYGGSCTSAQLAAARKIIAGQRA